jgi:HlyD family secretion protein
MKFPIKKMMPKNLNGKNKRIYLAGSIIIIFVIILLFISGRQSKSMATYTVHKGEFIINVTESGELKAASNFTVVAPRVYGKLQIVNLAPEGKTVQIGDMLVQFDQTEMSKKLTDKQNELSIAESDLRKVQADQLANNARLDADVDNNRISYELSKLNVEKMKFESESQQKQAELELERNKNVYDGSKQKIESQKIIDKSDLNKYTTKIKQIKADIEQAIREIDALTIKALVPGLVVYEFNWQTGKKTSIGDNPWPGMSLLSLPDLSKIQVLTSVNEVDVSKVKTGQSVKIKLDAFPDRNFTGKVSSVATIGKSKDQSSGVKVFEVLIDIDGVDPILKPGMTTSNEIITETVNDVVYVPLESVFEKDNKTIVYRLISSNPTPVEVKIGNKNANYVIIEQGLTEGDRVTLSDPTLENTDEIKPGKKDDKPKEMNSKNGGAQIMVK